MIKYDAQETLVMEIKTENIQRKKKKMIMLDTEWMIKQLKMNIEVPLIS